MSGCLGGEEEEGDELRLLFAPNAPITNNTAATTSFTHSENDNFEPPTTQREKEEGEDLLPATVKPELANQSNDVRPLSISLTDDSLDIPSSSVLFDDYLCLLLQESDNDDEEEGVACSCSREETNNNKPQNNEKDIIDPPSQSSSLTYTTSGCGENDNETRSTTTLTTTTTILCSGAASKRSAEGKQQGNDDNKRVSLRDNQYYDTTNGIPPLPPPHRTYQQIQITNSGATKLPSRPTSTMITSKGANYSNCGSFVIGQQYPHKTTMTSFNAAHPSSCHHHNRNHSHEHYHEHSPVFSFSSGGGQSQLLQHYSIRYILPLSTSNDEKHLSDSLCFVRSELLEVFEASDEDVAVRSSTRKKVLRGQVGLRCRFCAHLHQMERTAGRSSCFPSSINRIYQSVTMMIREHFPKCHVMPPGFRDRYLSLKAQDSRPTDSTRYWINSGKCSRSVVIIAINSNQPTPTD